MIRFPPITILIVTLNNERTLERCIYYIQNQDYSTSNIEYLAIDGGSRDETTKILQKAKFRVVASPIQRDAEAQRGIGLLEAKHNLIVSLDADNYIKDSGWLQKMVKPFQADSSIVHAGTMYYAYNVNDSVFNRYCSLFGMADPIVFYVGRPDRVPQYQRTWTLGKIIREEKDYYIVEFTEDSLPTVGCNGVVYRRDLLRNYARSSPREFLHIDIFADLVKNGYYRFAVVKNEVTHDTAASLMFLMKKRTAFMNSYYLNSKGERRYLIFNPKKPKDIWKMSLFIFYTVTFIRPLFDSIRGFLVIRDTAWFLHPLMCWVYLYSYGFATLTKFYRKRWA